MSKRKTDAPGVTGRPITASQGKALFKQMAKDEAKGNPLFSALLALFLPFLMKLLESFFAQHNVTPKSPEG